MNRDSSVSMARFQTRKTFSRTSSKLASPSPIHDRTLTPRQERKYFDSGDYALTKAGKAAEGGVTSVGSQHPLPENIPHLTSPGLNSGVNGNGSAANGGSLPGASSGSPVKESSFLHRETSADEPSVISPVTSPKSPQNGGGASSPPKGGIPIRWQNN